MYFRSSHICESICCWSLLAIALLFFTGQRKVRRREEDEGVYIYIFAESHIEETTGEELELGRTHTAYFMQEEATILMSTLIKSCIGFS